MDNWRPCSRVLPLLIVILSGCGDQGNQVEPAVRGSAEPVATNNAESPTEDPGEVPAKSDPATPVELAEPVYEGIGEPAAEGSALQALRKNRAELAAYGDGPRESEVDLQVQPTPLSPPQFPVADHNPFSGSAVEPLTSSRNTEREGLQSEQSEVARPPQVLPWPPEIMPSSERRKPLPVPGASVPYTSPTLTSEQSEVAGDAGGRGGQSSPQLDSETEVVPQEPPTFGTTQLSVDSIPSGAVIVIATAPDGTYVPWMYGDSELTTPANALGPALREFWVKVQKIGYVDSAPERVVNGSGSPVKLVFELSPSRNDTVP